MHGVQMLIEFGTWRKVPPKDAAPRVDSPEMLIIGLSGHATDKELAKAYEHGMHFFCPKPCTTEMLMAILTLRRVHPLLADALVALGASAEAASEGMGEGSQRVGASEKSARIFKASQKSK
jgi:hypothetical protein